MVQVMHRVQPVASQRNTDFTTEARSRVEQASVVKRVNYERAVGHRELPHALNERLYFRNVFDDHQRDNDIKLLRDFQFQDVAPDKADAQFVGIFRQIDPG